MMTTSRLSFRRRKSKFVLNKKQKRSSLASIKPSSTRSENCRWKISNVKKLSFSALAWMARQPQNRWLKSERSLTNR